MTKHANFLIELDPARGLIRIVMKGLWDEATAADYDTAVSRAVEAIAEAGCPCSQMLPLVDARGLGPQPGAVIEAYRSRLARPDRQPRRLATIVSSALFKFQVQRIAIPNKCIFEAEGQALEWLLGSE